MSSGRTEEGTVDGDSTDELGGDDHDRRRRRLPLRVLAIGSVASFVLAVATAPLGLGGAVAGAVFLSLLSLTSGIAGALLAAGVVVDQFRGRPVSGRRVLLTGGLVLLTLALLVAASGAFVAAVEAGP